MENKNTKKISYIIQTQSKCLPNPISESIQSVSILINLKQPQRSNPFFKYIFAEIKYKFSENTPFYLLKHLLLSYLQKALKLLLSIFYKTKLQLLR